MSGILYDLSKIRGIAFDIDGVLSPSTIPMNDNGDPMRMVNIKDGYALQLAVKRGLHICIITGGKMESVRKRYSALGIEDIILGASNKLEYMEAWLQKYGLKEEEVAYMGDDIPDIPCMMKAGLACAPCDADPEVKATAIYISPKAGGYGCARDLLEQILKAQSKWTGDIVAFGW